MFCNKYKNVGKTFIFKIFILPIKDMGRDIHISIEQLTFSRIGS